MACALMADARMVSHFPGLNNIDFMSILLNQSLLCVRAPGLDGRLPS
jgi:hypothetical protein